MAFYFGDVMNWNQKHIVEILQSGKFKTVKVVFNTLSVDALNKKFPNITGHEVTTFAHLSKNYTYKTNIENIKPGDSAIVLVKEEFKTVIITEVCGDDGFIDYDSDVEYKWLVCKVDSDEFFKRQDREEILRKEIKNTLKSNSRKEIIQELAASGKESFLKDGFDIHVSYDKGEEREISKSPIEFK